MTVHLKSCSSADATYITVTKQNVDQDFIARVIAVSHGCDLAILSVEGKNIFNDITPLEIGQTPPPQTTVTVAGYPIGGNNLSITRGVISRIEIHLYMHSFCRLLVASARVFHGFRCQVGLQFLFCRVVFYDLGKNEVAIQ